MGVEKSQGEARQRQDDAQEIDGVDPGHAGREKSAGLPEPPHAGGEVVVGEHEPGEHEEEAHTGVTRANDIGDTHRHPVETRSHRVEEDDLQRRQKSETRQRAEGRSLGRPNRGVHEVVAAPKGSGIGDPSVPSTASATPRAAIAVGQSGVRSAGASPPPAACDSAPTKES